ncbi:MAG TPA: Yip1 family protein, partial [Chthoniobacterales bacterium]
LTKPVAAFTIMRTEGDFGGPLAYAVIGGGIGAAIAFIMAAVASSFGFISTRHDAVGAMFGMTVTWMGVIFRLIAVAVAPFIWGALVHLSLMLLGGAKKSFETTFRVVAFAQGSTAPLQLVPCCGGIIAMVWNIVANCIGISKAHEIDTGRATLAVLLPLIVCCGGCVLLLFLFGGIAALSSHDWSH